jgi:hypothetical protein
MLPSNQPGLYDGRQSLLYKATHWLAQISATGFTPTPPPPDPYDAVTAVFDGTNDWMRLTSSGPTGLADGKTFTLSAWVKINGADGSSQILTDFGVGGTVRLLIHRNTSNVIRLLGLNAAAAVILDVAGSTAVTSATGWFHLYVCIDLANTSNRKIYIDGVADTLTVTTYTNDSIDFVGTNYIYSIAADVDAVPVFKGNIALSELWFNDSYLDDVSKFATDNCPISLGSDGSTPTGSAPVFYLKGEGNAFNVNSGTGGNFTVSGSLTTTTPPCS